MVLIHILRIGGGAVVDVLCIIIVGRRLRLGKVVDIHLRIVAVHRRAVLFVDGETVVVAVRLKVSVRTILDLQQDMKRIVLLIDEAAVFVKRAFSLDLFDFNLRRIGDDEILEYRRLSADNDIGKGDIYIGDQLTRRLYRQRNKRQHHADAND